MKKQIFALVAVGVAACCLGACKKKSQPDEYASLNEMLKANYSEIAITVKDTFSDGTYLKSEYTVTYASDSITVSYSIEQFELPSLEAPAPSTKTTLIGEARIQGDQVIFTGDEVDEDVANIAYLNFTFKKAYFVNADLTGNYLLADVKDPSGFLGTKITCSDMKLWATFLDEFYNMEITYVSEGGNQVKCTYAFTV